MKIEAVKVGQQIWMLNNLNVSTFRNGDVILEATDGDEWDNAANKRIAAYCYYDFNSGMGETYGKLYNWYAVNDARGLAPDGWHIPEHSEWKQLSDFLGNEAGLKLRSNSNWSDSDNEDEEVGFNAVPAGCCSDSGDCYDIGEWACWWTSTEHDTADAIACNISIEFDEFGENVCDSKAYGLSVRCVKD